MTINLPPFPSGASGTAKNMKIVAKRLRAKAAYLQEALDRSMEHAAEAIARQRETVTAREQVEALASQADRPSRPKVDR